MNIHGSLVFFKDSYIKNLIFFLNFVLKIELKMYSVSDFHHTLK